MQYQFSYHSKTMHPTLKNRPWWAIFRRDEIVMVERLTRFSIKLTEDEGKWMQDSADLGLPRRIITKLMGKEPSLVQLEALRDERNYYMNLVNSLSIVGLIPDAKW